VTPREVAEAYLASFATGDAHAISAWVTDDFVNEHTAALGSGCVGRDDYRARLGGFLAGFAGVAYDVEDLLADGPRVAAAYTLRARWQGEDGPPVEVRGVQRLLVRDGLIARRVDYWDSLQFLLQVDPSVRDALAAWL
jgi:ketosteroid isomerase-like protein